MFFKNNDIRVPYSVRRYTILCEVDSAFVFRIESLIRGLPVNKSKMVDYAFKHTATLNVLCLVYDIFYWPVMFFDVIWVYSDRE